MSIRYRITGQADYDKILEFILLHYYQEEPIANGVEPYGPIDNDIEFNMSNIDNGMCIVAEEESTGNFVGVLIAGPKYPETKQELLEEAEHFGDDTKWSKVLRLVAKVEGDSNVFKRYNVDKAMQGHVSAVDKRFRGQSISKNLKAKAMEVAKAKGYPLWTCDSTGFYSARVCEQLNMECVNILPYADYCDSNGQPIFNVPSPHKCIKSFAMQL